MIAKIATIFVIMLLPVVLGDSFAQSQATDSDDTLFIFVQIIVRNSDGQLVTYLESYRIAIENLGALHEFLDSETKAGKDPVIDVGGQPFQLIKRLKTITFESDNVFATTSLSDSRDGSIVLLAHFDHDGFPVVKGDELTMIWTIIRPAP